MTLRAQPPRRNFARRKAFALALLPFSVCLATVVPVPVFAGEFVSRPYLAVVSAPSLRFEERIPPPDLSVRPPAGAPPQPAAIPGKSDAASTPPAPSAALPPSGPGSSPEHSPSVTKEPAAPVSTAPDANTAPTPPAKPPASILPDDTRPKVRAEDFLPFFQFPGAPVNPNDITLTPAPPVPGQQPPSSATYRQQ